MEKEFVDGLIVKTPNEKAPQWVKANIAIKREELIGWLQKKQGEWINLQMKESKSGGLYVEVDNWKPSSR